MKAWPVKTYCSKGKSTTLRELIRPMMMSKGTITWSWIWRARWRKSLCVKRVTNRVQVMSHTSATRRVATVWLGHRAPSPTSESPAPFVTDILGAKHVPLNTSRAPQRKNTFVNESEAAQPVECWREAIITYVANGSVKSVSKTER